MARPARCFLPKKPPLSRQFLLGTGPRACPSAVVASVKQVLQKGLQALPQQGSAELIRTLQSDFQELGCAEAFVKTQVGRVEECAKEYACLRLFKAVANTNDADFGIQFPKLKKAIAELADGALKTSTSYWLWRACKARCSKF